MNSEQHYSTVARAIEFIHSQARQQPTLAEIAAAVDSSESHLQRVFSSWAGISPKRFLQYLTKEYARQALQRSGDLLSVTLDSGLSSPGRLHDLMISCEAMTPGEIKNGAKGMRIGYGFAMTPFGHALIGWTERGICYLAFCSDDEATRLHELKSQWPAADISEDCGTAVQYANQIFPYTPQPGKLHLVLRGTNFQIKVWEALMKLMPGERISYGQLAHQLGMPNAQRAVGSAVAKNNIGFLIPCHRVIKGTGDSGNYRWGCERKQAIQVWETGHSNIQMDADTQ
ncbi:methylated-DNA--[protein]-cysteine S-methyltransferase [Pontibacterium sp. N1Y112]|uniref:Methylated-DNA--[protein]-cysteine S-methyltransferase n=1 Tax=Pontibacterium sinense TaxID=2781979 RepID=A0A8J7K684_9GAMM|nr:methylated-DNA--[protein]-cysteine S-methyltransferase [Pontibacterium sinense]MBE9398060.1 methylated-DNA--[protein]-cysteine S-methyltransferase [Pontibacterium sinense]